MTDPPFLEVDGSTPFAVVDDHVRLDLVVGHRQQAHTRLPTVTQSLGDRGQGEPRGEHLRAHDVGGGVTITEPEPCGFHPIGGELFLDREGLVASAPAPLLVDPSAQGVHHRVQIRTDPEPEESDVITGVTDDCDGIACALPFGVRGVDPQSGFESPQESCSADTTGRYDYPHASKSGRLGASMDRLPHDGTTSECDRFGT